MTATSILVLSASFGCLKNGQNEKDQSNPLGYVTSEEDKLWPQEGLRQRMGTLETCWDRSNNAPTFPDAEKKIAQHVADRFKVTGITITGWADCPPSRAAHVKPLRWENLDDLSHGNAGEIGYLPERDQHPMLLGSRGQKEWCAGSPSYLESNCLLNIALHEMGHVFGLHHELNRPDVKAEDYCRRKQVAGERQTIQIGSPDRYSVMNYCRLFEANREGKLIPLSFGDILTLKTLYRGPMAYIELPFEGDQEYKAQFNVSIENLPIRIVGKNLIAYQFTWARLDQACHEDGKQWSPWIPLNRGISLGDLPKPVESFLYKPVKLCVVGKSKDQEQAKALASSLVVTFDKGETAINSPI